MNIVNMWVITMINIAILDELSFMDEMPSVKAGSQRGYKQIDRDARDTK